MANAHFNDPAERSKRAAKLEAESHALMRWYANTVRRPETIIEPKPNRSGTVYFVGPEDGPNQNGVYASYKPILVQGTGGKSRAKGFV